MIWQSPGEIDIAISDLILGEVKRNLRNKFGWPKARLDELESVISGYSLKVIPFEGIDVVKADPTDNRILECALAAKADFIVTGDKHFLRLKHFGDIQILKPADFLRVLERH